MPQQNTARRTRRGEPVTVSPQATVVPIQHVETPVKQLPVIARGVILPTLDQIKTVAYRKTWEDR